MANQSLGFSIFARDTAASTFTKLAQTVERLSDKLHKLDRTKADPEVTVRTARAQRDLDRFTATMRTKLAAAVKSLPDLEINANSSDVDRELAAIKVKMAGLRSDIELGLDDAVALGRIQQMSERLRVLGAQSANPKVRAEIAGALRALGTVEAAARALDGKTARVKVDVDGTAGAVGKLAAVQKASEDTGGAFFASANSFLHFAKTMSIVTAVVGLAGPVLGALGTAVAALPAFLFGVVAPAAAVMVGLDGIKASVQGLMAPFGQMKVAVSSTFQQGLTPVMQSLLPLFPMLTAGLQSMAAGLVNVARQTVAMVTSAVGVQQIGQIFAGVRVLVDGMAPAMAVFTQNLLTMAAVGIGEFSRLGQVFTAAAVQFRTMLAGLIETGVFQAAVRGFVDIMGGLLTVLNQVIGVAIQLGAQLATPITQALQAVGNAVVALGPIMALFGGAFLGVITLFANAIAQLAPVVTPIISVILGLAMTVLNALMPPLVAFVNQVMSAALPVLTQLAVTLGSVLSTAVQALAPLWPVLVSAIGQLLAAISPLIPQVAALATQLIAGLAPILPQLVGLFFQVVMAVMPLLPPIVQLASAYVPVLIAVIQALMPVITAIANAFLQVVGALMPLLPPIMQLVSALLPPLLAVTQAVMPVVVALANAFTQILMALLPLLPPILQLAMVILPPLAGALATAAQMASAFLVPAINFLGGVLSWLIGILVTVIAGIVNFVTTAITWFLSLRGQISGIWNGILLIFQTVWNAIYAVGVTAWTMISGFFGTAFAIFQAMWQSLWALATGLFRIAWETIQQLAIYFWNVMVAFWGPVFAAFQGLWTAVWNFVTGVFSAVWNGIRNTAITVWNAIVAFFQPAFIFFQAFFQATWTLISNIFSMVWNVIRNTAITLWNSISAYFQAAFTVFQAFFSLIWNTISAVFTTVWNWIRNTAITIWTSISAYFTAAFTVFTAFFTMIWNNIVAFFTNTWNWLRNVAVAAWTVISTYFGGAFASFTNFFRDTWNNIVATFDRIWSSITGIATRVWEGVKNAFRGGVNAVIDVINIFAGAINKVAGLLGFQIDLRIPRLEGGGPVQGSAGSARGPTTASSTAAGLAEGGYAIGLAGGGNTRFRRGGRLPYTGKSYDTIPAMAGRQPYALMGEEYVVQRPAARALGSRDLHAVNNAHRSPVDIIPRRSGGPIGPPLPEQVAKDHTPFLTALADGQAEAVGAANAMGGTAKLLQRLANGDHRAERAAGPRRETMPGYRKQFSPDSLRPIYRDLGGAIAVARQMSGKPYIWGGAGPGGADCSGYQSIITNALRNRFPYSRIGTTNNFPWPGFRPGLNSVYAVGAFKGNPGHMAGTLSGVNVEAGGSPSRVKYGAGAVGADSGQFRIHASLPEVGGVFASGGAGGGGSSVRWLLEGILKPIYDRLVPIRNDIATGFGNRAMAGGAIKLMDGILAFADRLGGGEMGATSNEAPGIVRIISDVARGRFGGLARKAAVTGTAVGLVESNLRNLPGGDRDSVGVFQQRPSQGWGTVAQCMNVHYAASKFFSRFPGNWASMDQGVLAQSVQRSAFPGRYAQRMGQAEGLVSQFGGFDAGGWLEPGWNVAFNGKGHREPILPLAPGEWRDMVKGQTGGRTGSSDDYDRLARTLARELRSDRSLIGSLTVQAPPAASAADVAHEISKEIRLVRVGGVHR